MNIREKFADFIGEYLSENGTNRENYGIKTEYYISDDVIVHWIRNSVCHGRKTNYSEWFFKTVYKDRISKKNTQFVAYVYDLEENPSIIYLYNMIPDPMDKTRWKKLKRHEKKIDNHRYFKRGSFLIEMWLNF